MAKARKQWDQSTTVVTNPATSAIGKGQGGAQWGAAVTLRALQSDAVPLRSSAFHQHLQQQRLHQQQQHQQQSPQQPPPQQQQRYDLYEASKYPLPPASSSGASDVTMSSGSGRQISSRNSKSQLTPATSDASFHSLSASPSQSDLRKASTLLSDASRNAYNGSQTRSNGKSLSQSVSNVELLPPLPVSPTSSIPSETSRHQSALGVYRPLEYVPPVQSLMRGVSLERRNVDRAQAPTPLLSGKDFPIERSLTASPRSPVRKPRESMEPLPRKEPSYPRSPTVGASPASTRDPSSPHTHERAHSNAQLRRNPSFVDMRSTAVPTQTVAFQSTPPRRRSNSFLRDYGLQLDSPSPARGGWDEDSEEEKRSERKRTQSSPSKFNRERKVSIKEPVEAPPVPAASGSGKRKTNLFKKAFRSASGPKKVASSTLSKHPPALPGNSILAAASPRPAQRAQPPPLVLASPSAPDHRVSPGSTISTLPPVTPGMSISSLQHDDVRSEDSYKGPEDTGALDQNFSKSLLPIKPISPSRRPSEASTTGASSIKTASNVERPQKSPSALQFPQMKTTPSGANTPLEDAYSTDDATSIVSSAQLLTIRKLPISTGVLRHRVSAAESIGSTYDQESWDGDSVRRESSASQMSSLPLPPSPKRALYSRKPSLVVAETSPLLALKEEVDETESVDGKGASCLKNVLKGSSADEKASTVNSEANTDMEEQETLVDQPSVHPTKYKIVRTTDDDSREMEYLDSIHIYPEEKPVASSTTADKRGSKDSLTSDIFYESFEYLRRASFQKEICMELERQLDNLEVNRFISDYGNRVQSVRASGFFDDTDITAALSNAQSTHWRDESTGKVDAIRFLSAGMLSALAYLSPTHFNDNQAAATKNTENMTSAQSARFHMDSLKSNSERLFMTAVPMYEMAFVSLRKVWRWDNKARSAMWCASYFLAWYLGMLLPSALAIGIYSILGRTSKRNAAERMRLLIRRQESMRIVHQIHHNDWSDIVREAQGEPRSPSTMSSMPVKDGYADAAEAVQRYGQALSVIAGKLADAHERVRNTFLWARTPATVRTLILMTLAMVGALVTSSHMLVRLTGFAFGVIFFVLAPIVEHREASSGPSSWVTLDPVEIMLAGVPNDAENAGLIMRRRIAVEKEQEEAQTQGGRHLAGDEAKRSSAASVQSVHARASQPQGMIEKQEHFLQNLPWASKGSTFLASYQGKHGLFIITSDRLVFRAASTMSDVQQVDDKAGTQDSSLDVPLDRLVQLDKIGAANSVARSSSDGLRITVRRSGDRMAIHTLMAMDMRDQAFNRIMALAPQHWQQQAV